MYIIIIIIIIIVMTMNNELTWLRTKRSSNDPLDEASTVTVASSFSLEDDFTSRSRRESKNIFFSKIVLKNEVLPLLRALKTWYTISSQHFIELWMLKGLSGNWRNP